MYFLNSSRQILGVAAADVRNTGGTGAGWVLCRAYGVAPAGTTSVRFFCFMDSTLGAATADFDAIYARRQVDSGVVAKMGSVFVDEVQAGSLTANRTVEERLLPNIVVDHAWYRGNCDPGTLGGAPNIARLVVITSIGPMPLPPWRVQPQSSATADKR